MSCSSLVWTSVHIGDGSAWYKREIECIDTLRTESTVETRRSARRKPVSPQRGDGDLFDPLVFQQSDPVGTSDIEDSLSSSRNLGFVGSRSRDDWQRR